MMPMPRYLPSLLVALALWPGASTPAAEPTQPAPAIIFDTDFGGDADDLGALAMLHHLADGGECELLAVMNWNTERHASAAILAVNDHFGRPVPLGERAAPAWAADWQYSRPIVEALGAPAAPAGLPEATDLYRRVLASRDDGSVTIVTVGPLANIQALLASGPDAHSPLDGVALVRRKVDRFVIMGGQFPDGEQEWNFWGEAPGVTREVLDALPVPALFSGYEVGEAVRTGPELAALAPDHPLRVGYRHFSAHAPWMKERFAGGILDNASFDQTAVLLAVRGIDGLPWHLTSPGFVVPTETGGNGWRADPEGPHRYLVLDGDPAPITAAVSELMMGSRAKPESAIQD